jgi:4a-hydroxytetrahydrobiopterin dehydratase
MGGPAPASLASRHCAPCRGNVPPLKGEELAAFLALLPDWSCVDEHHLEKVFPFEDFATGLDFVKGVGALAEQEGHHPDLCLSWGRVQVITYTHKIKGLSESDFILAAKIDYLYSHPVKPRT